MISERVARGVALLDRVEPGWFHRIDVSALNVALGDRCLLGQLYGGYSLGCKALGLNQEDAAECGFQVRSPKDPVVVSLDAFFAEFKDYPALTQEWRRVIEILRQKTATQVPVKLKELVLV